jgi:shikimate dehydrogenase
MEPSMLCGLIGAGIQGSLSPALQEEEARHHGIRLHYQLIDLERGGRGVDALPGLIDAARIMRFDGLNITHPCKQLVIPLLDELSPEAALIGAVNTVVRRGDRLLGHNTDGAGWSWGFRRALPAADLSRVVLIGAGGAGSACADAVLRLGAGRLVVVDRDAPRATALAARLNAHFPGGRASASPDLPAALRRASGLIHATPTGTPGSPGLPLPPALLRSTIWVSDVVHVPLETALLKAARQLGCETVDGGHMNVGQALRAFALFTGREPDAARMEAHFRRLVPDGVPKG